MMPGVLNSLLLAFAGLVAMGFACLLVDNEQRRRVRLRSRLAQATTPHLRIRAQAFRSSLLSAGPGPRPTLRQQVAGLIGLILGPQVVDPKARWSILGGALVLGRLAAGALTEVAGPIGWLAWPVVAMLASRGIFEWLRRCRWC